MKKRDEEERCNEATETAERRLYADAVARGPPETEQHTSTQKTTYRPKENVPTYQKGYRGRGRGGRRGRGRGGARGTTPKKQYEEERTKTVYTPREVTVLKETEEETENMDI